MTALDAEDLRHLAPAGTREAFAPGDVVLHFGQADADLLVVESGELEVVNPADHDGHIATRGPGEFVGDIDLITRRPISYGVRALGDGAGGPTRVLRIPGERVRALLNSAPRIGEKLITAFQVRRRLLEGGGVRGFRVIGPHACRRTTTLRAFLHKNFVPFTWVESDSPHGAAELANLGEEPVPALDCGDGRVLFRPTLREAATVAGVWRGCPDGDYDLAIVGAGPAGIAAAVYAASEGLRTIVLDRLGPGGQIGGSSMIENFIGFPAGVSGTDLATRGVLQLLKFGAELVAPVSVDRLEPAGEDGVHALHLDCGTTLRAAVVLACTGVAWRRLAAENASRFERASVHYSATVVEAHLHREVDVAVVGAGNSAGQAVMFLAERHPDRTVHMLVRRTLGPGMSAYLVDRIRAARNVAVHEGVEVASLHGDPELSHVRLVRPDGGERSTLAVGGVFVFIGADPHTEWLPDAVARDAHGFVLTGADVVAAGVWPRADRAPYALETSIPGLLAGGDVRAGGAKRVGFAVGDGSLAVTCANQLRAVDPRPARVDGGPRSSPVRGRAP